jgi:RNA polymerase sigma-70 factor (ECF subfamily)
MPVYSGYVLFFSSSFIIRLLINCMSKKESHSEEGLLSLLKKDDWQGFDEIYWKYQKAVYQNVFKLTRDSITAEDIVQEVFISLWEKRHSIDIDRSVGGWLFVSSYNRSINELKKKLRESLAIKEMQVSETDTGNEPDLSGIQLAILEKAITELSPQKRKVFELCKLQGRTYEEAAKEIGISKHTVKEYLSGAMSFIKEYATRHPEAGAGLVLMFAFQ